MLALHPRVVDAIWAAIEGLLPKHREAALDLSVALILTTKLVKWRKRYGPVFAAA